MEYIYAHGITEGEDDDCDSKNKIEINYSPVYY